MSLETEIKVLQDNMKDLQGQLNSAHIRISEIISDRDHVLEELKKEKEYAKVKDINQRIIKSSGRLKEFQLQRSVQVLNTMYLEITKNLELSKLTLLNQTPNINILDKPVLPLKDNKISAYLMLIICAVLGLITSIFYFLIQKLIRDSLNS